MADIEKERAFEAWARSEGYLGPAGGVSFLGALRSCWLAASALHPADAAEMKRLADALEAEATQAHITGPTARAAAALLRRMAGG